MKPPHSSFPVQISHIGNLDDPDDYGDFMNRRYFVAKVGTSAIGISVSGDTDGNEILILVVDMMTAASEHLP